MKRISTMVPGLLLLLALPGLAQRPEFKPEERRERLQDLYVWKLLEVLDLSTEQSDRFLPTLREMQKQEAALKEQKDRLLNQLEEALRQEEDSRTISNLVGEAQTTARQSVQVREDFFNRAKGILSVQQLGKLVLFHDRFDKHLREMIRDSMEEKVERRKYQQEQ